MDTFILWFRNGFLLTVTFLFVVLGSFTFFNQKVHSQIQDDLAMKVEQVAKTCPPLAQR